MVMYVDYTGDYTDAHIIYIDLVNNTNALHLRMNLVSGRWRIHVNFWGQLYEVMANSVDTTKIRRVLIGPKITRRQ